uniref:mitogen-activated protein kinase kinase n=1 Tax=Percolomonas cosmopolitus TaxID=63605 RepID=A0A7S1KRR0_9EUKA|eukprot:CAMPEP_0117443564 /NCGR_PEP_ID=MMETSP0759-20121206/4758_1 /TAXON_ID=63605 /ORGANISM="Percolomonas cosmopolitus, Strain WS" /LENGTH=414 /DNA_ID=CAMNT_0005235539 /DNA_START=130 /DNA_END=1374 /DNA_ORIENTATION=+
MSTPILSHIPTSQNTTTTPTATIRKKRRLDGFKPKLKLVKMEPDTTDGNKVKDKSVDETYVHKISESGNFVIATDSASGQHIKVGDTGIQIENTTSSSFVVMTQTPSAALDPNFAPLQRTTLEDFKVIKRLGCGAQGSVDKVKNVHTKQIFARKTFKIDSSINASPKMLITEFRSLYSCECKNIIRLYHAFHKEGTMYMVLELMNCGSLEDVIKTKGRIPEQVIHKMCVQMLNGLHYLHTDMKIVHRDLKPANILVNDKGIVKLADFGMAGHYGKRDIFTTYQGSALYMSPERLKSEPHTYNSDVWSLGVTLAEAALGRPLFPPSEVHFLNFKKGDRVPLKELEGFSAEFQQFIALCLQVNADDRPSAKELLHSPFILKYYLSKPSLQKWLRKEYVPHKKKEKLQKKEVSRRLR